MRTIVIGALLLSATGCVSQRVGDFTVMSTKSISVEDGEYELAEERVQGENAKPIVFVVPLGKPDMKEATDRAIESHPGAVGLADVTIERGGWYIPFIYGQDKYVVEGTPIVKKEEQ